MTYLPWGADEHGALEALARPCEVPPCREEQCLVVESRAAECRRCVVLELAPLAFPRSQDHQRLVNQRLDAPVPLLFSWQGRFVEANKGVCSVKEKFRVGPCEAFFRFDCTCRA